MVVRISVVVVFAWLLAGCGGAFQDKNGWSHSQKRDLVRIASEDKYASLCGLKMHYDNFVKTKDSKYLTKLMVGYTKNLANSCIDLGQFRRTQSSRNARRIKTHFDIKLQEVSEQSIMAKVRAGHSIESILKPYKPTNPQFDRLLEHYHALKKSGDKKKLRIVKHNLERIKLMNPVAGTYILINAPEYKFRLFERDRKSMEFGVIVGKRNWQTPIFSSTMKYIVLNPTWSVPDNIARDETIPRIARDASYLKRNNMYVRATNDSRGRPVNATDINWAQFTSSEYKNKPLPYKIVQRASNRNVLGKVKFMFPNRFAVYMHDTQSKGLFKRKTRAYSHGCIRLSQPQMLLDYFASKYTRNSKEEVEQLHKTKRTQHVYLKQELPVHIGYYTAYADEDGTLRFYGDVYGFDRSQRLIGTL